MGLFSEAAWIAKELGDLQEEEKYRELAGDEPKINPKFKEIYRRIKRSAMDDD